MKTTITLHRDNFVQQFLLPLSKLTEKIILTLTANSIVATCSTVDASVVLCAEYKSDLSVDTTINLNIPDIKKLLKLLNNVDSDQIVLTYNENHLAYTSKTLKFKYFLLEDGYVQRCPVSSTKIRSLTHDSSFFLSKESLSEILRGQTVATDAGKVYFYLQDDCIHAELNDRERCNINNITYFVSDGFEGEEFIPLAVDLESLRMLTGLKGNGFTVKINTKINVLLFDIDDTDVSIRFAISALVK